MQRYRFYFPALLWFCFILFATLTNVNAIEILNWRNLFSYDKPIHMFLFGMQAYLVIFARRKHHQKINTSILFKVCFITALFGASIEYLQIVLTSTRSFDYFDMIANALGCVIAYFMIRKNLKLA